MRSLAQPHFDLHKGTIQWNPSRWVSLGKSKQRSLNPRPAPFLVAQRMRRAWYYFSRAWRQG